MTSFDGGASGVNLAWTGGTFVVLLAATYVAAKIAHRHNVIDTTWGLFFVAAAVVTFIGDHGHVDTLRRWLLLVLPVVWGVRLAQHVGRRSLGKGEDPRYDDLLNKAKGPRDLYALRVIYLTQGVIALLIAAPILVGGFADDPVSWLPWVGVVIWATGVFFETVGDAQMERFRGNPDNKGKVIDVGLWRYTRHPNYFGDACVWWGIYVVAASALPGVYTLPAPIIMTLLLTKGTGARILEKHMSKRDGWDEYAAQTSMFFPLPPKVKKAVTSS